MPTGLYVTGKCTVFQSLAAFSNISRLFQPGVVPGECWCFHGQAGTLVVEMADNVKINSFSIEHISAKQSVTGEINSAPKEIEIYVSYLIVCYIVGWAWLNTRQCLWVASYKSETQVNFQ